MHLWDLWGANGALAGTKTQAIAEWFERFRRMLWFGTFLCVSFKPAGLNLKNMAFEA